MVTPISRRFFISLSLLMPLGCGPLAEPVTSDTGGAQLAPPLHSALSVEGMHAATPSSAWHTRDGRIVDSLGATVTLQGVNWFGFDDGNTAVDGLWAGDSSLTQDFATVVRRMHAMGFNAVRLPFSFKDWDRAPKDQARTCRKVSEQEFVSSVMEPGHRAPGAAPSLDRGAAIENGKCSSYLPTDSTFNRLVWVTQFFARNGFRVVLDNQLNLDRTAVENSVVWLQNWKRLIQAVSADAWVARHVIVDMLNEPDSQHLRWEGQGGKPGVTDLYLAAMDALYPLNHHLLFFVEGTGQGNFVMNWGDGLVTDAATIARTGISDPNPFFKALLTRPYLNNVVVAPHVYPPSISKAQSDFSGPKLFARLDRSFGTLNQAGYCSGGKCHRFPIVIGETGSAMRIREDAQMLPDFARYLSATGPGADGQHQAVSGWFWWAWNANSGDTGGLVSDNWQDLLWHKFAYLKTLGLRPWYQR
jgi:aryl-phospho-beta-D-glucosidase BglC (GH1 family)